MKQPPKPSKRYSILKKTEYDQAIRTSKRFLDYEKIATYENQILSRNISALIQSETLTSTSNASESLTADVTNAARIRYKSTLGKGISGVLDLGIKHTISDYLYQLPRVRKAFDSVPSSYSSFGQSTGALTDFVLGSDTAYEVAEFTAVAEFNSFDDLTKKEQDAIRRAEEELYRIAYSLEELEDRGLLTAQEGKQYRTQRMSYEERYRFLYLIRNIDNFKKKAEASKYSFIADTYMQRRQGVLVEDFGGKYDTYVKEKIKSFLQEESRYISSIQGRRETTDNLRRDIEDKLREYDREVNKASKRSTETLKARDQYKNRAEMIIATEVSTAYNFGKLIGFSGMEDLEKEFVWNADWELEFTSRSYEVCKYCRNMDGRKFTLRELLIIGTQLDVGAGGFGRSGRRTDFKNPSLPMIPSHPHCACFDATAIVTCEHGNIPIGLIKVGDRVKVPTQSEYETVTKVHKNWYTGNAKKITIDYGSERRETITCTENHPFWTSEGWKDANNLRVDEHAFIETKKLGQTSSGTNTKLSRTEISDVVCREPTDYIPSNKGISHSTRHSISQSLRSAKTGKEEHLLTRITGEGGEVSRIPNDTTIKNICATLARIWRLCKEAIFNGYFFKCIESRVRNKQQSSPSYGERYESASSFCQSIRQNVSNLWSQGKMRLSRGLEAVFQKWLGSRYCKDIQYIKNYLEVRTRNLSIIKQYKIYTRFLSSRLQSLCRSKGKVETVVLGESTDISGDGKFFIDNSGRRVQGFEENFQGLSEVRVISIENVPFNDYVYNLTVSNTPVYFVNDVLVHNCFWALQQDDRRFDSEMIYEDVPIENIRQLDPKGQIIPKTKGNLAMQLAGVGMVVGGAFLLSRSNIWNSFAATLASRNVIPFTQIEDVLESTFDYVGNEFSDDIGRAVADTVRDVVNSSAQLPVTKIRPVALV